MSWAVLFSSASDEWATPQDLFDALDAEFHFQVDLAASAENTKCPRFFSMESDALLPVRVWGEWSSVGWCNPPYSRGLQSRFIAKAAVERLRGFTTVMLLPARTDTKAFHAFIYDATTWRAREGAEIRFLAGRLKFGGAANSAPFPSMVVIFRGV